MEFAREESRSPDLEPTPSYLEVLDACGARGNFQKTRAMISEHGMSTIAGWYHWSRIDSTTGESPLHIAVRHQKSMQVLGTLLGIGVDPDNQCYCGRTPIFYSKNKETVSFLVNSGASLDIEDYNGFLPLHFALICKQILVAREMIRLCNEDVLLAKDGQGRTVKRLVKVYAPSLISCLNSALKEISSGLKEISSGSV